MEEEIKHLLSENNIDSVEQYKSEWLGKQSLDFYIPSKKIAIECQGRQHFEPVDVFGGDDMLKLQTQRDLKKKQLCNENRHQATVLFRQEIYR